MGIEPTALCLGSRCSTTELRPLRNGPAGAQRIDCRYQAGGVSTEVATCRVLTQMITSVSSITVKPSTVSAR